MVEVWWIILLQLKSICVCSVTRLCKILKYIMCFSGPEPPEARTLKQKLKYRNILDKELQESGKKLIKEVMKSCRPSRITQQNFDNRLYKVHQAHQGLIEFVRPYLTDDVRTNIFINEKLVRDIAILKDKNAKLVTEKLRQKEQYEEILARRANEKNELDQNYSELIKYYKYLEAERKYFQQTNNVSLPFTQNNSVSSQSYPSYDNLGTIYKGKQQQFEEILKTKNDKIHGLKLQLSQCKTELENRKTHNSDIVQEQAYYHHSTQNSTVQIETEERKAKEQQRIQQQFEETLKTKNSVIQNLKLQLSECETELHDQKTRNSELIREQSYYRHSLQINMVKIENEKKKVKEQEKLLYLEKLEAAQQEFEHKNYNLQTTLSQREQQLQKVYHENKMLQEQMSKFEENLKQEWHSIKQRLFYTIQERDSLKTQIVQLQREISQYVLPERHQTQAEEQERNQAFVLSQGTNQQDVDNDYVRESLKKIENIHQNAKTLETEIREFSGTKEDRTFLHLQELLIRSIVKLDNVETEGYFVIRKNRKEVIQYVQELLNILKGKT